ncbi:T9SS type A sorting domain-containing protein [candidate division KSB1 bacterium]|nr:T9SS type A sorting domain-containing protein [candidate division KSB1 bacterium]
MKKKNMIISLILLFLFTNINSYSQSLYNGGKIPESCQETWHVAGLINDVSTITPVQVFTINAGLPTDDDYPKVETAIGNAQTFVNTTDGLAIIYFPEGWYYFNSPIPLNFTHRNIVFQGDGAYRTHLVFRNMPNSHCFNISGRADAWSSAYDLDQNFYKGDSVIHSSNGGGLSGLSADNWVQFVQYNFNYHSDESNPEKAIVGQITQLERVTPVTGGLEGEIKDVANMDYVDTVNPDYSIKIRRIDPVMNIGIENLNILRIPDIKAADSGPYYIRFGHAVNCWVKGVISELAPCHHIGISSSTHCEVSGCYIHEAMKYDGGGWGYGVCLSNSTTNCLIENNIFRLLRHAMTVCNGVNCNVFTFNYSREQTESGTIRDIDFHGRYPFGNLFEHNYAEGIGSDDEYGNNGDYNTFVRNRIYDDEVRILKMDNWSSLGNIEKLDPGLTAVPHHKCEDCEPTLDMFGCYDGDEDCFTHNAFHNNYIEENAELLDVSYYYSSQPYFLTVGYTWSAIGPKVTTPLTQNIPARGRYDSDEKTYLRYPIHKSITTSGTLPYDETWLNGHTLTGDVFVPTGLTLTLPAGNQINIGTYNIISTGGTIDMESGVQINPLVAYIKDGSTKIGICSSVQNAINYAVDGNTVTIKSGTYVGNLSISNIDNLTVTEQDQGSYVYIDGNITCTGADALGIGGIYCNRLSINYCAFPDIAAYVYGTGTSYGVFIYQSSNFDVYANVMNCDRGLLASYSSGDVNPGDWGLTENGTAVYANSANTNVYEVPLCESDDYHLLARSGSYIYADGCYYDDGEPDTLTQYGGYIQISGEASCDLLEKPIANNISETTSRDIPVAESSESDDPLLQEYTEITLAYFELSKIVKQDIIENEKFDKDKFKTEYKKIIDDYRNFIKKYYESELAKTAFSTIVHCFRQLDEPEAMLEFIGEIKEEKKLSSLYGLADRYLMLYYQDKADYTSALATADNVSTKYEYDDALQCDVLYAKGIMYAYDMKKTVEAIACFSQIIQNYPDQPLADCAANELERLGESVEKQPAGTEDENLEFSINNYPNPFNPSTHITFTLPERDVVTLKVFDILGREVAVLMDGTYNAGTHDTEFNASQMPSGVYFYHLSTSTHTVTRKMLVVK